MRREILLSIIVSLSVVCALARDFSVARNSSEVGSKSPTVEHNNFVVSFRQIIKNNFADDNDITSSVANLPKPQIPQDCKWNKRDAIVNVEIAVNEKGSVFEAKAVSGNTALKKPSEKAALRGTFTPPTFEGEPLSMSGVIAYDFVDAETVTITIDNMRVELTPAIEKRLLLKQKLHSWVYNLVERLEKGETKPTFNEASFVFEGKAEIQIILTKNTAEILDELKKCGLEIENENNVKILGRIAVEKIAELAQIEQVRYISP